MFERKQKSNEIKTELKEKDQYVTEKVTAKSESESVRLTKIEQEKLTQLRADNLYSEMHKISEKHKLKGDKKVFKNDEEFKESGLAILKRYNATDAEIQSFLKAVENPPQPK